MASKYYRKSYYLPPASRLFTESTLTINAWGGGKTNAKHLVNSNNLKKRFKSVCTKPGLEGNFKANQ